MEKKVENELTLKCAGCSSITQTPKFASFEDIFQCADCECNLAHCDRLYYGFSKSPLLWINCEWEVEDEMGNIKIIKAEIITNLNGQG